MAEKFKQTFSDVLKKEDYSFDDVCNTGETGLIWKAWLINCSKLGLSLQSEKIRHRVLKLVRSE